MLQGQALILASSDRTVSITAHSTANLNVLFSELFGDDVLQGSVMAGTHPSAVFCRASPALLLLNLYSPSPRDCSTPHLLSLVRLTRDSWNPSAPFHSNLMVLLQDTLHCRRDNTFLQYKQCTIQTIMLFLCCTIQKCLQEGRKKLKAPSEVPWTAKTPHHQYLRGYRLTRLPCGSLSNYLLSDLPGIFTRDIFAAKLQTLR